MKEPSRCPDGGRCHHSCVRTDQCFRVRTCSPLSGVFPNDEWPDEIAKTFGSDALEVTDLHQAIIDIVEEVHDIDGYEVASAIFDHFAAMGISAFVVGDKIVPLWEGS